MGDDMDDKPGPQAVRKTSEDKYYDEEEDYDDDEEGKL